MSKRIHQLTTLFVLLWLFATLVPAGARVGLGAYNVQDCFRPGSSVPSLDTPYFSDIAFQALWDRTDKLVANETVKRSFYWGPGQVSGPIYEEFRDPAASSQTRMVQYFDKGRMEINAPCGNRNNGFFVTNGLLTVELVTGRMQVGVGKDDYRELAPANIPLASDSDDRSAPTYASFKDLIGTPAGNDLTGQIIRQSVDLIGLVPENDTFDRYGVRYGVKFGFYNAETKHNIADKIWDFLNARGPTLNAGGQTVNARLSDPWFYTTGYAISEPYWASVKIAGKQSDVLIQLFERRVVTYVPDAPEGFKVQMGNIGLHYLDWRYRGGIPGQAVVYEGPGPAGNILRTNGKICRDDKCFPAKLGTTPAGVGYYNNRFQANPGGTISAMVSTTKTKFRLKELAELQLKARTDLSLPEAFLLSAGSAIFDHPNGQGEIEVDARTARVTVVDKGTGYRTQASQASSTKFSVELAQGSSVKVAVVAGNGVLVTRGSEQPISLEAGKQLVVPPSGTVPGQIPLDDETKQLWGTYGDGGFTPTATPTARSTATPTATPTLYTGGHIVFRSDRAGNYDIWRINGDGTNLTQLTQGPNEDHSPDYSPDGSMIAFASSSSYEEEEIYVRKADGTVQRLTYSPGPGSNYLPAWSPDGKRIVFTSSRKDSTADLKASTSDLYVMNADGTDQVSITQAPDEILYKLDYGPSWGANDLIAFDSWGRSGTNEQIFTIRPDGTGLYGPLTSVGRNEIPTWNKLGKRIVFSSLRDGHREIYTMGPNGEDQVRLTNTAANVNNDSPSYSPDGSRIVFSSNLDTHSNLQLYTMDTSGQDLRRLTNSSGNDYSPSWTADGAAASDVPYGGLFAKPNSSEVGARLYAPHLIDGVGRVIGSFFAPLRDYAELRNSHAR
jgi:Tol biopolymer transport system component